MYVDVPEAAKLRAEEVFGPVVVITPYDEIDEAFAAINRSRFGLQASIFTRDIGAVLRAHAELEVGALVHDDATATRIDAQTYGGVKESGVGREGPRHAVLELTEPRLLLLRAPNLR